MVGEIFSHLGLYLHVCTACPMSQFAFTMLGFTLIHCFQRQPPIGGTVLSPISISITHKTHQSVISMVGMYCPTHKDQLFLVGSSFSQSSCSKEQSDLTCPLFPHLWHTCSNVVMSSLLNSPLMVSHLSRANMLLLALTSSNASFKITGHLLATSSLN